MNVDAEEAAIGLLSMGHSYLTLPTPSPATSSATLNSILTTTASPLSIIPQKRKQGPGDSEANSPSVSFYTPHPDSPNGHQRSYQHQPPYQPHYQHYQPTTTTQSPPATYTPQSNGAPELPADASTEGIDCICGFAADVGLSIACDTCPRWCHAACFGIEKNAVPEKFACWICKPRSRAEKERAVKLQKENLDLLAVSGGGEEGKEAKRRRNSPGVEKRRRTSAAVSSTVDSASGKRKRRASVASHTPTTPHLGLNPILNGASSTPNGIPTEEEHIDIDTEPWKEAYVHISDDIIPNDETRAKLRRQASHWRGVTAVATPSSPPIAIKELPPSATLNPFLALNSNPDVLPPTYSLHTTQPIPSQSLITPFRACITPSSSYLADPLNSYAHLGMPKPYVHLMGPPLEVALDARIVGNHGRFVRRGCRPNAVLRPVLCDGDEEPEKAKEKEDDGTLGFGVFALRDLRANEEIVLGWEWDDGNAVHSLPALLEAPSIFPSLPNPNPSTHDVQRLKNQMSNILHALSSTFTTCACGARARDCALTQMAAFVDGHDLGRTAREHQHQCEDAASVDMGPLVGRKRGFKTRERIPNSGGMGGMELAREDGVGEGSGKGRGLVWDGKKATTRAKETPPPLPSFALSPSSPSPSKRRDKGKERADGDVEMLDISRRVSTNNHTNTPTHDLLSPSTLDKALPSSRPHPSFEPRPPDPSSEDAEERMPPKMRKRWMHKEVEAIKELNSKTVVPMDKEVGTATVGLGIRFGSGLDDEQKLMPPPPMPASLDPTTICSTDVNARSSSSSPNPLQAALPPHNVPLYLPPSPSAASTSPTIQHLPISASSPLASFADLSILSPALVMQIDERSIPAASAAYPFPDSPHPEERDEHAEKPEEEEMEVVDTPTLWSPITRVTEPPSTSPPRLSSPETSKEVAMSPLPPSPPNVVEETPLSPPPMPEKEDDGDVEMETVENCNDQEESPSSERANVGHTPPSADPDSVSSTPPPSPHAQRAVSGSPPLTRSLSPRIDQEDDVLDYSPQSPEPQPRSPSPVQDVSPARSTVSPPRFDSDVPPSRPASPNPPTLTSSMDKEEPPLPVYQHKEEVSSPLSLREPSPCHDEESISIVIESAPPTAIDPRTTPEPTAESPAESSSHHEDDVAMTATPEPESETTSSSRHHLSAAAAPKVKMSLRDFALRKKKQREEMELTKSIQASPMSVNSALGDMDGHEDVGKGCEETETEREKSVEVGEKENTKVEKVVVAPKEVSHPWPWNNDTITVSLGDVPKKVQDIKSERRAEIPLPLRISPAPLNVSKPRPPAVSPFRRTSNLPSSLPSRPPLLLPARPSTPTISSPLTTKNYTREAKQELMEHRIPLPAAPTLLQRVSGFERSISPISPDPGLSSFASRISQEEDGEIGEASPPPARHPLPPKRDFNFAPRATAFGHSHSPPTGPRSLFNPPRASPVATTTTVAATNSRPPPPIAPRALRQSLLSNRLAPGPASSNPPQTPSQPNSTTTNGASQYIPRGPSADRERDRDRSDWDQRHYRAPQRRGGHGWGR